MKQRSTILCASLVALAALTATTFADQTVGSSNHCSTVRCATGFHCVEQPVGATCVANGSGGNSHVCVEVVDWKDKNGTGHSVLGTTQVNGGTIEAAASACHGATLAAFVANKAWSAPDEVCANTHSRHFDVTYPIVVWALDQFQDMPGNWNRVEGYTVECGLKGNVPALVP